jgi:hypothetical protein
VRRIRDCSEVTIQTRPLGSNAERPEPGETKMELSGIHNGHRFEVSPRALRDGGICYDVTVRDMLWRTLWTHTITHLPSAVPMAKRWIDGTDRSVGFSHYDR